MTSNPTQFSHSRVIKCSPDDITSNTILSCQKGCDVTEAFGKYLPPVTYVWHSYWRAYLLLLGVLIPLIIHIPEEI